MTSSGPQPVHHIEMVFKDDYDQIGRHVPGSDCCEDFIRCLGQTMYYTSGDNCRILGRMSRRAPDGTVEVSEIFRFCPFCGARFEIETV